MSIKLYIVKYNALLATEGTARAQLTWWPSKKSQFPKSNEGNLIIDPGQNLDSSLTFSATSPPENDAAPSLSPEGPPVEEVVAGKEGARGGRALDAGGGRGKVRAHRRRRREETHTQVAQALPQVRVRRAVA